MDNKEIDPLMNIAKSFNDVSLSASLQGQVLVLMELQVHIQTKINELNKKIEDTSPLKK
jgi:hypothetical protein